MELADLRVHLLHLLLIKIREIQETFIYYLPQSAISIIRIN